MARAARSKADNKYNKSPKGRFRTLKISVRKNGYAFNISFKAYKELLGRPCTYCKTSIDRFPTSYWSDRADSTKGYVRGNVVPCCPVCNMIKGELLTVKEAKSVIKYLKRIAPSIFTGSRRRTIKRIKARSKRKV